MLFKTRTLTNPTTALSYAFKEEKKPLEIYRQNLFGENPIELGSEFEFVARLNNSIEKPIYSLVVSPTISDGERLEIREFKSICKRIVELLKVGKRQAIAIMHRDKEHKHLHIYISRIDLYGERLKSNHVFINTFWLSRQISQEFKLQHIEEVSKQIRLKKYKLEIDYISKENKKIMSQRKPSTLKKYIELMKEKGITVRPVVYKHNILSGFRFGYKSADLKGSWIERGLSVGYLCRTVYGDKNLLKNSFQIKVNEKSYSINPVVRSKIERLIIAERESKIEIER